MISESSAMLRVSREARRSSACSTAQTTRCNALVGAVVPGASSVPAVQTGSGGTGSRPLAIPADALHFAQRNACSGCAAFARLQRLTCDGTAGAWR